MPNINPPSPPDLGDLFLVRDLLIKALEELWEGHRPFADVELALRMLTEMIRKLKRWEYKFYFD